MSSAVRRRYQPAADADADHRGDYDPRFTIPEHLDPKKKKPSIKTVALAFALLISGTVAYATEIQQVVKAVIGFRTPRIFSMHAASVSTFLRVRVR